MPAESHIVPVLVGDPARWSVVALRDALVEIWGRLEMPVAV